MEDPRERSIYENSWVNLWLADVETPDGHRWEHHVVKLRHLAVAAVVNERCEVLMTWRHRFINGRVGVGAAPWAWSRRVRHWPKQRPVRWWRRPVAPRAPEPLIYAEPVNGITDSQHHVFRASGARFEGPPTEKNESDRIEWFPLADVRGMIDRREIVSRGFLVGLLSVLMDEAIR